MRAGFRKKWTNRVHAALRRLALHAPVAPARALPELPVGAEWDEAFLRVESYLRAHQIESRVQLTQLTAQIVAAARALAAEHPGEPPVTLAMQVAHARIGAWLVQALGEGDWTDERFRVRARLAILLAEIPRHCPQAFLAPEALPEERRLRLAAARLLPGPDVRLSRMPLTRLEFPLAEAVEAKWVTFSRSAFVRGTASWLVLAGLLSAAWFATR